MRTALAESIVTLFEQENLRVSEIAASLEVEESCVKSVLLQFSNKFRESEAEEDLVSRNEVTEFMEAYKSIARDAEEPFIREKALRHLINMGLKVNDGLGVIDQKKLLREIGGSSNILNLNMIISKAREEKKEVEEGLKNILELAPAGSNE